MKGGQNLRDLQQKQKTKEEEIWVKPQSCHACGKVVPGAYGHTTIGEHVVWSCSGACEKVVQQKRKDFYDALFSSKVGGASPVGS
jgi:hypothetical protein